MKINNFTKWEPLPEISSHLTCEGLHDDYEGFRILLKGTEPDSLTLRITFDPALAYRNVDEGDLLQTISEIKSPGESSLFIVKNSSWKKWFNEESSGLHNDDDIIHYAIYTADDCIDVLSAFAPNVEWLND